MPVIDAVPVYPQPASPGTSNRWLAALRSAGAAARSRPMKYCLGASAAAGLLASSLQALAQPVCPPDLQQGEWSPAVGFTVPLSQDLGCQRVYNCGPRSGRSISSGCEVVAVPLFEFVAGACMAGASGPCEACLTITPSLDPCQWHLEPQ